MDISKKKIAAFDLDGTITQHRTPVSDEHYALLSEMAKKYKILMVGAGMCERIFHQLREFPVDIVGCYGMQFCAYDKDTKSLKPVYSEVMPCDRESVYTRARAICDRHGYTDQAGDLVCFHSSGAVTIALLGNDAKIEDKLKFDPDRKKRRAFYDEVVAAFPDYNVFVGGSSSFDMAPKPYNKFFALDRYCRENGLSHDEVVFFGDDYGTGGNDECVYLSDFDFVCVDDYRKLCDALAPFLK